MEVAGQWRREWAGTAEYGKVTEGGVTKRVARAMEVLNASAPGARVRVMRAAYHSTAGPGVPASSYMLQSSRRVISSGYDFVEPKSLPSKPLEISSIPLEIGIETESNGEGTNYKVTEPDDTEISEPSKWRSATGKSSIRFPSEESSSTDNASIIDLDSRTYQNNSLRKHIFDSSHESVKSIYPKNNRVSPLLDAPVTLSTLKYKSLLNGSDDWNNRRKSYSFEDTTPSNKNILERIDRFAIESSTDSGICKSSEVVNDIENTRYHKPTKERKSVVQDETFKDWLFKNRISHSSHSMKPLKEDSVTPDRLSESNITLQSSGKMCITLPITIETENDLSNKKPQNSDDNDRKSKKVEFCKTELHFAADTGTVNIIATDEKPPPTNDFRRRRSAFVPINGRFEKSVTLFGEKTDFNESGKLASYSSYNTTEISDSDENTAATKSILKNKIPKPKPYLLGENMILGNDDAFGNNNEIVDKGTSINGVSLINSQLKPNGKYCREISTDYCSTKLGSISYTPNAYRSTIEGTFTKGSFRKQDKTSVQTNKKLETVSSTLTNSIKKKLQVEQTSPTLRKSNTRQLRESDLTYFGIEKNKVIPISTQHEDLESSLYDNYNEQEEIFESVRLVRKASNSVCSSEIESDEAPEYQNVPSKLNYAPVPAPRLRSKYVIERESKNVNLNSIEEQETDDNGPATSRRSRLRRNDSSSPINRSISEPPKVTRSRHERLERSQKTNTSNSASLRMKSNVKSTDRDYQDGTISEDSTLYVNLTPRETNVAVRLDYKTDSNPKPQIKKEQNVKVKNEQNAERSKAQRNHKHGDSISVKPVRRSDSISSKSNTYDNIPVRTKTRIQRTEKLVTPELPNSGSRRMNDKNHKANDNYTANHKERDHQKKASHRHANSDLSTLSTQRTDVKAIKESRREANKQIIEEKFKTKQNKHSLINNNNLNNTSPTVQTEVLIINQNSSPKSKITEKKQYDPKKTRRSEYVINYDDKNGTVSSVRKLKPFKLSSEPKKNSTKANKENSNEQNGRTKQLNKIALQQIAEQQTDHYEKGYMDKTSKRKTHVHKPCQLL